MPLNSVMAHTKEALVGLVFPSGLTLDGTIQVPALQAHISPPVGTVLSDSPHAFVWGGTLRHHRQTMGGPRAEIINTSSPFRELDHRIDIVVRYAMSNNLSTVDSAFPAIIDTIVEKLSGVQMPIKIVDQLTGRPSTIVIIGEEFDISHGHIYSLKDQRFWLFGAKITMPVKETIQQ